MKNTKLFLGIVCGLSFFFASCNSSETKEAPLAAEAEVDVPIDHVTIGTQVWKNVNLNVATFNNGDLIPQVTSDSAWSAAMANAQPAWCYYDNNPSNGNTYGRLYNLFVLTDSRGIAPAGWHVPDSTEWMTLINYCGGFLARAGVKLKSRNGWPKDPDTCIDGGGTDETGFKALPGGSRGGSIQQGNFMNGGENGSWWGANGRSNGCDPYYGTCCAMTITLSCVTGQVMMGPNDCSSGMSVRLIRD